ncbi:MAG TPA: hypothetical protein ACFCUD_00300 [Cyclobacteriaceae bacterium]
MKWSSFYVIISALSIIIISISGYYLYNLLGGFKAIEIKTIENIDYIIAGQKYYGRATNPEIEGLFNNSKDIIIDERLSGNLAIVHYMHDSIPNNYLHYLIGVSLSKYITEIPANYTIKRFRANSAYYVKLDMHAWVRPTPEKISDKVSDYAGKDNDVIEDYSIELYDSIGNISVIFPVK